MTEKRYSEPITYYDKTLALDKASDGSPHSATFAELYDKVRPFCARIGLKRLSDITGLDRIGIPVVNAVRPNAGGMSVSHGKGVTLEGAKGSALMESIERYHGFNAELDSFHSSYEELSQNHNTIPLSRMALSKRSAFNSRLPEKWVMGWDIVGCREVAVPLSLVLMGYSQYGLDSFFQSSNGLAGSLKFIETLTQALFEVIERDALACQHQLMRVQKQTFPLVQVKLETIISPLINDLLLKIEKAEVLAALFDCTVDSEIPTYECFLLDRKDPKMIMCRGMGCALDVETAMVRTITEAVQARAVYLSGCRETFFMAEMMPSRVQNISTSIASLEQYSQSPKSPCRFVDAQERLSIKTSTFEEDINICLEKLKNIGLDQVIVVDLAEEGSPFSVLRVIVPGLEGVEELINYAPGSRSKKIANYSA
ncbi:MAG: YcaO-like family protein [Deltaproteobacteria bacterium]|nr:YcaO-like family protein [Deltaproteobacteria bacterium]